MITDPKNTTDADIRTMINNFRAVTVTDAAALTTLTSTYEWVLDNSDGWSYYAAPRNAAAKLVSFLHLPAVERTPAAYKKALTPIKTFKTKTGAGFAIKLA